MYWEHTKSYILAKSHNMATNNDLNYVFIPWSLPSNNFQPQCNELKVKGQLWIHFHFHGSQYRCLRVWRNKISMMTIMVQTISAMGLREADSHFLRPVEASSKVPKVCRNAPFICGCEQKKSYVSFLHLKGLYRAIFRGCAEILILLRNIQLWRQTTHHINFVSWVIVRNTFLCGCWSVFLFSSVVSS